VLSVDGANLEDAARRQSHGAHDTSITCSQRSATRLSGLWLV
jgi:hypothetical protein